MRKDMCSKIDPDNIPFCDCPEPTPPDSGECCCTDPIRYALELINAKDSSQDVSFSSFNTTEEGKLRFLANFDDIVKLVVSDRDIFYPLCNIDLINFSTEPEPLGPDDNYSEYNCDTINCCCNESIATFLKRRAIGPNPTFPIEYPSNAALEILTVANNNSPIRVIALYGICNGILWAQAKGEGNDPFVAIPLCEIFSIELGAPEPPDDDD